MLQVLQRMCSDAAISTELFLNFDCAISERNVFERLVGCLAKIVQGRSAGKGGRSRLQNARVVSTGSFM